MNTQTNHLVETAEMSKEELTELKKKGYEPVPKELQHASERLLNGRKGAFVSKNSGGKLSKWASKKRKVRQSKKSRKANR